MEPVVVAVSGGEVRGIPFAHHPLEILRGGGCGDTPVTLRFFPLGSGLRKHRHTEKEPRLVWMC